MNPNQLALFERDGFLQIREFLDDQHLSTLQDNLRRVITDVVPRLPVEHVFFEQKSVARTLKQIQHLEIHDDYFRLLMIDGPFRRLAENLLGGPVTPKNLQYFNKPAGMGKPTPPHQDGYYFMLDPCEAVTIWLALDHVDQQNGCVRYVPGSHRRGMRDHARTGTLGFSQGIPNFPTDEDARLEVACPTDPGDLLVHHALTIHRADGNRSTNRSRQSLGFVYYSQNAKENFAAKAAYQKELNAELRAAGKI